MEPNGYDINVVRVDEVSPFDYSNCYVYGKCSHESITFFCIDKDFSVRKIIYEVTGSDAMRLIRPISRFYCCQRYWDIHD